MMCKNTATPYRSIKNYIKSPDKGENDKYQEIRPEDTEICNLNNREFKIAIIKQLNELKENVEKQFNKFMSYFTKELETIKKNQSEILERKDTINEIKQNMDSLNARADITKEQISIIENRHIEMLQIEEERELRLKRNEQSLREISDSIRKCNIRIIGIPEGEERENGVEGLFKEIISENCPNLGKEMEIHVEEAIRSPKYVNVKRPTAMHIVVKLAKLNDKENTLSAARQKKTTYKGTPIRLSADFSAETLQARREWNDIFKSLKDKNFQPRKLYSPKISFRYDGEIKTLPDKQKLREFRATRPPNKKFSKRPSHLKKRKRRKGLQSTE
uniref:L1 transposable element RRM domain-containing protein n=1 Tax=Equus caballus TaxID=9796 RepID=A0A9L0T0J7_HORSE